MPALLNTRTPASPSEPNARPATEFGYSPDSGMAYRRCADGRWYVLDVTGAEGLSDEEAGVVPLQETAR